jgi:putative ABC transport system substrate-binding protein
MNRRDAGRVLLLGPLALGAAPFSAKAQQAGKVYRLGYLSQPTRESVERGVQAFVRTLRELGWVEGQNLIIEYRWADGKVERLPELAAELIRLKVDVIVAPSGPAAQAAKNATSTIPIVMIFPSDPVALGLVGSLARPGGNVTGTTFTPGPEIFGKQLQILKEAVPNASRIAILRALTDKGWDVQSRAVETAARSMGVRLQHVETKGAEELDDAFAAMSRERTQALLVAGTSTFLVHRARLAELALKYRLPTMFNFREMVEAGGMMAYAVNMAGFVPRAAAYVDKILRGAKPADLPIEQPSKFELVINLKTAKALGITLPQSLLLRAETIG